MINSLRYCGPSLHILHQRYAKASRIDERVPIQGLRELVINAATSTVWSKLVYVHSWAPRTALSSVAADREIAWTGSAHGAEVVHCFELEAADVNATHVVVEESVAGPLLGLNFDEQTLLALLEISLHTLKSASETHRVTRPRTGAAS